MPREGAARLACSWSNALEPEGLALRGRGGLVRPSAKQQGKVAKAQRCPVCPTLCLQRSCCWRSIGSAWSAAWRRRCVHVRGRVCVCIWGVGACVCKCECMHVRVFVCVTHLRRAVPTICRSSIYWVGGSAYRTPPRSTYISFTQ